MNKKRRDLLKKNTFISFINQIVTVLCTLVLPRQMILYYGSEINGLVSSITQFLTLVNLLDLGVGTVVQAALYKPLAYGDVAQCNRVLSASKEFYRRIAYILLGYTVILSMVYPHFIKNSYGFRGTAFLILIVSASLFSEYLLGINNQALLNADQKSYIHYSFRIVTSIINVVTCVVLMKMGFGILFLKTVSTIILVFRPIAIYMYIRVKYKIDFNVREYGNPIPQKWNGIAHHLAAFVFGNTDIAVISIFLSLKDVSIYSIYIMVVSGLNSLYASILTGTGTLFGELYAKNEIVELKKSFLFAEWISHNIVLFLYFNTGILLTNFVLIYTDKITDAEYSRPVLSLILTMAYGICCLRNVYNKLICAAGHFKQTQWASILEASINLLLSVLLVRHFGLVGVAIGTLAAVTFSLCFYFVYVTKAIVFEEYSVLLKQLFFDFLAIGIMFVVGNNIHIIVSSYFQLFVETVKMSVVNIGILLVLNSLIYKSNLGILIRMVIGGKT